MVNVTHNNDNRTSWLQILCLVLIINDKSFLDGNDNFLFNLCAQLVCNDSGCIKVNDLVDTSHYAESHELFDND